MCVGPTYSFIHIPFEIATCLEQRPFLRARTSDGAEDVDKGSIFTHLTGIFERIPSKGGTVEERV